MSGVAQALAVATAAVNGVAGVVAAFLWWRVQPARLAWVLLRCGQAVAVVQAIGAGGLAIGGFHPADGLYWLYALLPVAVGFFAEQLRLAAAQGVLDARGLENAQAVGRLDEAGQRSVVLAILRRELGTMAAAALVTTFLALRALGTI